MSAQKSFEVMRVDEPSQVLFFPYRSQIWAFWVGFDLFEQLYRDIVAHIVVVEIENVSCGLLLLLFSTIQVKSV